MEINEKETKVIIDALVTKIKDLELEVWLRDERIKSLMAENEEKKGGAQNG